MLRRIKIRLIADMALLAVGTLSSCQPNCLYHSFQTFNEEGWNKSDTLVFDVSKEQIVEGNYNLQVELRNTQELKFKELWLVVYANNDDSLRFKSDTLQCKLVNEKGRFVGSGLNRYYQTTHNVGTLHLSKQHNVRIKLAHYMKKGRLQGIHDVGIRLTRRD